MLCIYEAETKWRGSNGFKVKEQLTKPSKFRLTPDLIMFGSSEQAMDLQSSDQWWARPGTSRTSTSLCGTLKPFQMIFHGIISWTLGGKCSHWSPLGNSKNSTIVFTVTAKPQQWWDRFTSVKIQTTISDTNWSITNQTKSKIWILAENEIKYFQPEQGRSSSSDSSRNTWFYRVPNSRASAEGCGQRLNQKPSPIPQLHCLRSVSQFFPWNFPKFSYDE